MTDTSPSCCICASALWDDEQGRYICRPCETRIDRDLIALAGPSGLYARLCLRTGPSKRAGGPAVSGTRNSTMPPNEQVLNLIANGGIVSDLETWVADWATYGLAHLATGGRLQYRVDQAVATLRLNLTQAALRHPALDEFGREIGKLKRTCHAIIDGERQPIRIPVHCNTPDCDGILRVTLDTDSETCRNCRREYGHTEALKLTPTERRAAA
ncbi:hypothetical protein GLX30_30295 [Streptomyces sp. Tu 2975]|uniref:hypothetical protein n=1 Tax=Streptomyces sp. Tu 2975 TaxID=2676871 RepID=UPI001356CDE9|nr:hypothetical protein [Streptomyces sp. Tu 2975]QIP87605.1 hypothetical protein GLX30_30295 [Streptomyces sp. Tu 2975]